MRTLKILVFTIIIAVVPRAAAQPPSYKQVLAGLSSAEPQAPVTLAASFFTHADTTARGKLQRGIVLVAAAGKAREISNHARALVLITSAKNYLNGAVQAFSSSELSEKSRAYYTLGQIAEAYDGNLSAAQGHYQQAVNLKSTNQQAQSALLRVQRVLQSSP